MRKRIFAVFCAAFLCSSTCLFPENGQDGFLRSIDDIFPVLDVQIRERVFSPGGYFSSHEDKGQTLEAPGLDSLLRAKIDGIDPSVMIEYLLVIPYPSGYLDSLDIYNSLRRIRALGGRLYHSETRGADIPLFENATRLESARRTSVKDDPPPKGSLPDSETIYIRLKDANFGNSYYQVEVRKNSPGFIYDLFNNRDLTYFIVPVIKAGYFVAQFYFEPLDEGVLVYGISGAKVSDFVASKVDISSAIQKRLEIILSWVIDGISGRL
jgi:hypothetical protein